MRLGHFWALLGNHGDGNVLPSHTLVMEIKFSYKQDFLEGFGGTGNVFINRKELSFPFRRSHRTRGWLWTSNLTLLVQ